MCEGHMRGTSVSTGLAGRTGDLIDFNRRLLAGVKSRGERRNPGEFAQRFSRSIWS